LVIFRFRITAVVAFVFSAVLFFVPGTIVGEEDSGSSSVSNDRYEVSTFAGGCFWCMEPPFEKLSGVVDVVSGYTGGFKKDPTYEEVSHTETGHVEAVQLTYDPTKVSYEDLLGVFWRNIDPTDSGGQFVDRGSSYLSAIFYHNESQQRLAELSRDSLVASGRFDKPIVTPIRAASTFYRAEEYHQDYYKKSPLKYKYYRYQSGRDKFLESVWETPKRSDTINLIVITILGIGAVSLLGYYLRRRPSPEKTD
jgi:peptide methionine sulfoxide reductase msrA/msrB